MSVVIRVLPLMMLASSTAHTFLFRWFVRLVKVPSSPRLVSKPVTEWLQTHLLLPVRLLLVTRLTPMRHWMRTPTLGIVGLKLPTLCKSRVIRKVRSKLGEVFGPPFFYYINSIMKNNPWYIWVACGGVLVAAILLVYLKIIGFTIG